MRVIILAAGQGTRLRPLTNNKPKCMVSFQNMPLIEHQLKLFERFNITNINVITGYLQDKINFKNIKKVYTPKYVSINMVTTLFCADELFDGEDDILISYGDIIYNETVLKSVIEAENEINVVIDKKWKKYWSKRMPNLIEDAETFKINQEGYIQELGKKLDSYDDIQGQYIGLVKIRKDIVKKVKEYYKNLDKSILYDGKDFENMYMTSFLQTIADNLIALSPVYINNGWIEVNCPSDLDFGEFLNAG